jgi:hypothetical protein
MNNQTMTSEGTDWCRLVLSRAQINRIISALDWSVDRSDWINHEDEIKNDIIPLIQYLESKDNL